MTTAFEPIGDGTELSIETGVGPLPALWSSTDSARAVLVLAHGAGAGMRHVFMNALSGALLAEHVATLRYEFPYMAARRRRPDPPRVLHESVRAACERARTLAGERRLFAGGKSMGGRMTSEAHADAPIPGVRGLVFVGFPLHPAGKPGIGRAQHLGSVGLPMLFVQGTRDALADRELMNETCRALGPRAALHEIDGADHAFVVRRSPQPAAAPGSGRGDPRRDGPGDVCAHIAHTVARWVLDQG